MLVKKFILVTNLVLLQLHAVISLEQLHDSDLVRLLTGVENVIVLFTKNNCEECNELESVLESIQDGLKKDMNAIVGKAHNSNMVGMYNPSKEPALISFRRGIPLLYYGPLSAEEIYRVFVENREPIVKELSDENFEHLTQSATGATTGDWFLFFYSPDCILCLRLNAVWEAVGVRLKHRLNIARIDRQGAGIVTAKRFKIMESPEFIFIREGKFYRFKGKDYSTEKLINFAEKDFLTQTNAEVVPPEVNMMSNYFLQYIESIQYYSGFWIWLAVGLFTVIGFLCSLNRLKLNRVESQKSKKAK